jgi:hypothetical protein
MGFNFWMTVVTLIFLGGLMAQLSAWACVPYVLAGAYLSDVTKIMVIPYTLAATFLCVPMSFYVNMDYSWGRYIEAAVLSLLILYYFWQSFILFFMGRSIIKGEDY